MVYSDITKRWWHSYCNLENTSGNRLRRRRLSPTRYSKGEWGHEEKSEGRTRPEDLWSVGGNATAPINRPYIGSGGRGSGGKTVDGLGSRPRRGNNIDYLVERRQTGGWLAAQLEEAGGVERGPVPM
jgi:hypothetical protein